MIGFASFLIRLVGYAIVFGVVTRFADALWNGYGLNGFDQLQSWHDETITAMTVAPVVVALISMAIPRLAIFITFVAIGAVVSAPYAFERILQ